MKLKVLHFSRKFLPFTYSFVKNQIENHITYEPAVVFKELVSPEIHACDLLNKYHCYDLGAKNNLWRTLLYKYIRRITRQDLQQIEKIIELEQVKILHFHFGTDAGMYYKIFQRTNLPSVVSFYGYDCSSFPHSLFGYGKYYLQKRVFSKATRILAMSQDMKKDLINLGCPEEKITVHYYGTDVKRFYISREYGQKEKVELLILSSLYQYKGHHFLLEAIRLLCKEGKRNFHLTIAGKGILEDELKEMVSLFELNEYVSFYGYVKYGSPEMIALLEKADVFIHPSVTHKTVKEGIPGAIIEAMSSGLPVISTYHAGIPYVIESGESGLLVNEWDINQLSSAIFQLIDSVSLREKYGKKGQQYALSHLDVFEKEKELETIYNSLL